VKFSWAQSKYPIGAPPVHYLCIDGQTVGGVYPHGGVIDPHEGWYFVIYSDTEFDIPFPSPDTTEAPPTEAGLQAMKKALKEHVEAHVQKNHKGAL
jgi:hypothetical protein